MTSSNMMWFWEEAKMSGQWAPVGSSEKPDVVSIGGTLRLKCVGAVGTRVRAKPMRILPRHKEFHLDDLQRLYGGDT